MITVYYSKCVHQLSHQLYLEYLGFFPAEITNKIARFRKWEDAQASLLGKVLLKKGLENMNLDSDLSKLKYTGHGKPFLDNAIHFNISHSGPYIVCAFSTNGAIGADIEQLTPIRIEDFINIFQLEEWYNISTANNPSATFYYYWTAKEAIIKADGRGLSIPLKDILIKNGLGVFNEETWYYYTISLHDNCILQIASDKKDEEVRLIELNICNHSNWPAHGKERDEV